MTAHPGGGPRPRTRSAPAASPLFDLYGSGGFVQATDSDERQPMTDPRDRIARALARQDDDQAADDAFADKAAAGELTVDDLRARLHPRKDHR